MRPRRHPARVRLTRASQQAAAGDPNAIPARAKVVTARPTEYSFLSPALLVRGKSAKLPVAATRNVWRNRTSIGGSQLRSGLIVSVRPSAGVLWRAFPKQ